jgi:addiction module HigA family antidote
MIMALTLDYEQFGYGPPHPGEILREQVLPQLALTKLEIARRLGVSRRCLSDLLAERSSVGVTMARRLGQAFGNGARYWLAVQMQHDIWQAERTGQLDVQPIV